MSVSSTHRGRYSQKLGYHCTGALKILHSTSEIVWSVCVVPCFLAKFPSSLILTNCPFGLSCAAFEHFCLDWLLCVVFTRPVFTLPIQLMCSHYIWFCMKKPQTSSQFMAIRGHDRHMKTTYYYYNYLVTVILMKTFQHVVIFWSFDGWKWWYYQLRQFLFISLADLVILLFSANAIIRCNGFPFPPLGQCLHPI